MTAIPVQGRLSLVPTNPDGESDSALDVYFVPIGSGAVGPRWTGSSWVAEEFTGPPVSTLDYSPGVYDFYLIGYSTRVSFSSGKFILLAFARSSPGEVPGELQFIRGKWATVGTSNGVPIGRVYVGSVCFFRDQPGHTAYTRDTIGDRHVWNYYNRRAYTDEFSSFAYAPWTHSGGETWNAMKESAGVSDREPTAARREFVHRFTTGMASAVSINSYVRANQHGSIGIGFDSITAPHANSSIGTSTATDQEISASLSVTEVGNHYLAALQRKAPAVMMSRKGRQPMMVDGEGGAVTFKTSLLNPSRSVRATGER